MAEMSASGFVINNSDDGVSNVTNNSESDEEGEAIPSSHHMSNYKNEVLDCENDAGRRTDLSDGKGYPDDCEPPRKRARRGLNKEANGDIEFEIIDEIEADDQDHGNGDLSDDDDLSDDEIYAWLEEGVDRTAQAEKDDGVPIEREKVVLKEKGHDPFDILPEGWVVVTHNSGMPVYLHKETRVCTLARPYFLGPGSVRKHDIPLSAIPCLQYKRELNKETPETQTEIASSAADVAKQPEQTANCMNNDLPSEKTRNSERGNTLPCSEAATDQPADVTHLSGAAGTMETNASGQETSSALAFGRISNISKTEKSHEKEDTENESETAMEEDDSSSVLVTSSKNDPTLGGHVDERNQIVTSQSKPKSPPVSCPFKPNSSEDLEEDGSVENVVSRPELVRGDDVTMLNGSDRESVELLNDASTTPALATAENGVSGSNSKEEKNKGNVVASTSKETTQGDSRLEVHPVKVESAEERRKQASLDPSAVRDYCSRLFEFKTITVRKYKTWRDRRRHMTQMKKQSRPELPPNTKLITCSLNVQTKPGDFKSAKRKEFLLNPSGKSYVCILHEYVQHTMRVQPRYIFKEMESALTPYSATVVISDVEYGVGFASSKKAAKLEAAKSTLNILIPEMNKVTEDQKGEGEDLSFFDEIKIEDPRIYELGNKAGQPSPYQILCECLRRNYGLGETHCEMEMKQLKHQKSEFTMTVGKHTATVIAKNKRDGKQRAAQAILQKLHAHVTSWGSLLRLYGKCSEKYFAEKKDDMNINELQAQVKANRPNNAILDKLKEEMTRLHMQRGAIKSKGKLRLETTELPAKVPSLDL